MIHSWDTVLVVVRVVDNLTGKEHFLDPTAWVQNNRWTKHADMTMQYAHCLRNNLLLELDGMRIFYICVLRFFGNVVVFLLQTYRMK